MSDSGADVIQGILSQSQKQGLDVSHFLATFVAKSVVLQDDSLRSAQRLSPEQVQTVTQRSLAKLSAQDDPALETMKMQSVYVTALQQLENEIRERGAQIETCVNSCISASNETDAQNGVTQLAILQSGVELSLDSGAENETRTAVATVMQGDDLSSFLSSPKQHRASVLDEFWRLALGLRIFNKFIAGAESSMPDIPNILFSDLEGLELALKQDMNKLNTSTEDYARTIGFFRDTKGPDSDTVQRLICELNNKRQFETYVHTLMLTSQEMVAKAQSARANFDSELSATMEVMQKAGSASVPKEQIYPRFLALSYSWSELSQLDHRCRAFSNLRDRISVFASSYAPALKASDVLAAESHQPSSPSGDDDDRPSHPNAKFVRPEDVTELDAARFELQGFCSYSLVQEGGVAVPGVPSVGYVNFEGKNYAFSSENAAVQFTKDPAKYINGVTTTATRMPELVYLLDIDSQIQLPNRIFAPSPIFSSSSSPVMPMSASPVQGLSDSLEKSLRFSDGPSGQQPRRKVMVDSDVQTPVHIVEKHIDPKYRWNEWDLRRDAIRMTNLRNKKTHSAQTAESHFRRDNETQVYLPKTQETQTRKDSGTNPKKVTRYVSGLRGGPSTQMKVVNLTLDL